MINGRQVSVVDGFVWAYKYRQFIRKEYKTVVYLLVMLVLISIQRIHTTNNTNGTSVAI
jgi:hypothetical protein